MRCTSFPTRWPWHALGEHWSIQSAKQHNLNNTQHGRHCGTQSIDSCQLVYFVCEALLVYVMQQEGSDPTDAHPSRRLATTKLSRCDKKGTQRGLQRVHTALKKCHLLGLRTPQSSLPVQSTGRKRGHTVDHMHCQLCHHPTILPPHPLLTV